MILRTYRSRLIAYALLLILFLVGAQLKSYLATQSVVMQQANANLKDRASLFETQLAEERNELARYAGIVSRYQILNEYVFVALRFDSGVEALDSVYNKQFGWLPIDRIAIASPEGKILMGEEHADIIEKISLKDSRANTSYIQGKHGLELVATAPIEYKGDHLGLIMVTRTLDKRWMAQHRQARGGEIVIEKDGIIQSSTLSHFVGQPFAPTGGRARIGEVPYHLIRIILPFIQNDTVHLWIAVSTVQISQNINRYGTNSLLLSGVGVVVILSLGFVISRNFDKPLGKLATLTREIAQGALPAIQKSETHTEIGILTNQFADMVQALREKENEVEKFNQELEKLAITDALTGIFNRRAFEKSLDKVIESAKTGSRTHALCYIDLDQFKIVNDTCGHIVGDELLQQITTLLQSRVRERDILARLGGDEFGLILSNVQQEQAIKISEDFLEIIRRYRFSWSDKVFEIGASIGLAFIDQNSTDRTDVLRKADIACYSAKYEGRNRVKFYKQSEEKSDIVFDAMSVMESVREAFQHNKFCLWAQPIQPIFKYEREINHVELLIRMIGNAGNIIQPGIFIPVAERYGMMPKIDRWVINASFDHIKQQELRSAILSYSINLSGLSLGDPETLEFIKKRFFETKIPANKVCFEITETAAVSHLSIAVKLINELKKIGFRFSLDDFGTGLSSFQYLKFLPVDYVKIDGTFVSKIVENPLDAELVKAMNSIAHILGKKTIAEYVESKAILEKLEEFGVDFAQGYYTGKPQPLLELEKEFE